LSLSHKKTGNCSVFKQFIRFEKFWFSFLVLYIYNITFVQSLTFDCVAPLKIAQAVCPNQDACPEAQYSYYVKAGTGIDGIATICFNGEMYVVVVVFIFDKQIRTSV